MDDQRFDSITRHIAGFSRRSFLKSGFMAAAGAAFGLRRNLAGGQAPCTTLADCGAVPICEGESCVDCFGGYLLCGAYCADLVTDPLHCGACGNVCPTGICQAGVCIDVPACDPGLTRCGTDCIDLQVDVYNCGVCGSFCGGIPGPGHSSIGECVQGQCEAVCLPGADDCDGQCTDRDWDVRNCGSCGNQCLPGETCCLGQCVDRGSAERFCDFCGFQGGWPQGCNDDEVCSGGLCLAAAPESSGGESTDPNPADAAYQLSVLESQAEFDTLYDRMHPDAQIVIPRGTVLYWYSRYFSPLGPQPIVVTGVEYADWTWEVIGRTYPGTAVVSFEQSFADSSPVTEVVRLVQDVGGSWRWFFGRSAAFVEEMNAEAETAGLIEPQEPLLEATGQPPSALFAEAIAAVDAVSPACLDAISLVENAPSQLQGAEKQEPSQTPAAETTTFLYLPVDRAAGDSYPDLIVRAVNLEAGESPETMIAAVQESIVDWEGPEFSLPPRSLEIDLAPASAYLVSYYEEYTEVLGHVPVFTWGERLGESIFAVTGPEIVAANELLAAWSQSLLTSNTSCAPPLSP